MYTGCFSDLMSSVFWTGVLIFFSWFDVFCCGVLIGTLGECTWVFS